ncbi:MAG: helix-turn-helix transcriptional regulator [Clostridia bacterium]|nr:helix-turn-helix transcriptional regulator [Clostridia bacterium]
MEIEKKLKDAREKAGLTQEQVAEAVMVSRQTISNWENAKSLPDIISVIKLSDLYKISVDELLKGDQKMQKKIEKDANIAKTNIRVILVTAIITLAALAIYFISIFVGGAFNYFCENAIKWVLVGIGIAFVTTYLRNINGNHKLKFKIGVLQMKKLQIIAIILLLFGIWLTIFPVGQSSKIDELIGIVAAVSGLLCGVLSLFANDK